MENVTSFEKACEYILAHPDESKKQQAAGADTSERTIAMARKKLIADGKLAHSRKGRPSLDDPRSRRSRAAPVATLDHAAMLALAEIDVNQPDLSDERVQKLLLRQVIRFALDPTLHPDTRMSATQQWGKLKDMVRQADLGPGIPLTRADRVTRLSDQMKLCGPDETLDAFELAFNLPKTEHTDERNVPADADKATPSSAGATPAP